MDFAQFHIEVINEKAHHAPDSLEYHCLDYIGKKLVRGITLCLQKRGSIPISIADTPDTIKAGYKGRSAGPKQKAKPAKQPKKKASPKKKKGGDLGKLVDQGEVPEGNSDAYWRNKGIKVVFAPDDERVRHGAKIPASYKYNNVKYLENYYNMSGFEFGNWLSQQDRFNYLSGLGLALYDLQTVLGFTPKQMSLKGKLTVAFGARGRGRFAAHFEPGTFVINLSRYSRPAKVAKRPGNFSRESLMLSDGGVGAYAHEFGHALDYYAGTFVEKAPSGAISEGKTVKVEPHKPPFAKGSLRGLMEALLAKIIWKNKTTFTDYYKRLKKATKGKYYFMRSEIFARAFEVYVQAKLSKKGYHNIFLNDKKYDPAFYLTPAELKKVEKDFDALMGAIKKHL